MKSRITRYLRVSTAKRVLESFEDESVTKGYLFIGYPLNWANSSDPPASESTVEETDYDFWRYMLGAKKITENDTTHAIPRYDWTSNTVYRQYDSTNPDLYATPVSSNTFFVVNSGDNVYKCLFNNNGVPSTDEPTGTTTGNITTNDGYIWKFMYAISSAEALKFKTNDFINIQTLSANDGSAQWTVQQNVANGAINVIEVDGGGTGYLTDIGSPEAANSTTITLASGASTTENIYNDSTIYITGGKGVGQLRKIIDYSGLNRIVFVNTAFTVTPNTTSTYHVGPDIIVRGDGVGATAYANVLSESIEKINTISAGLDYSYANVTIEANSSHGSNASVHPIISPPGGHGSDAVSELAGHNVTINVVLDSDEANTLTTNNDFRQIGLMLDPLEANGNAANSSVYNQTTRLTVDVVSGTFIEDERIAGEESGATGFVVQFANTNASGTQGVLSVIDVANGSFQIENVLSNSGVSAAVTSIKSGDFRPFSGDLIYLQNREKVERSSGQKEDFKLTITF